MVVRRLGWAGLEVMAGGASVVVDPLADRTSMEAVVGQVRGPLPQPAQSSAAAGLVTHLHLDHTDAPALAAALQAEAPVLRPARAEGRGLETIATVGAEEALEQRDLAQRVLAAWDTASISAFTVTAVPAVDGFGDPQVSWVIEAGGRRILHAGDTLFHGSWWLIAMRHGPFDAVFLPVNGAVCDLPHRQPPSPLAATMDPDQAAAAAHLLGARLAVPIHYDAIHHPPAYAQTDRPAERFHDAARRAGVAASVMEPGEVVELGP